MTSQSYRSNSLTEKQSLSGVRAKTIFDESHDQYVGIKLQHNKFFKKQLNRKVQTDMRVTTRMLSRYLELSSQGEEEA